jgi:DNA-binding transcriptional LysR family regulator
MNWDDLRIFLIVARVGLVSRAATELGLDPTTVSRRVQRLEKAVGQTLLVRERSGPRLTEAGRRLLADAEAVERTAGALGTAAAPARAILRVSATEGFGTWFIAHHLATFARDHAHVQVDLVATSGFLSPSKRETDVAILLARPRRGPLVTRKLSDYALRLYASTDYLAGTDPVASAADLSRHPLVGYIPDFLYAPELDYLGEIAPGLEPTLRSTSINAQYRMIASGAGVGVLPRFIGDADVGLAPVLPAVAIQRSFWLSTHRDTRTLDHVDRFVAWLVALTARRQRQLLG